MFIAVHFNKSSFSRGGQRVQEFDQKNSPEGLEEKLKIGLPGSFTVKGIQKVVDRLVILGVI